MGPIITRRVPCSSWLASRCAHLVSNTFLLFAGMPFVTFSVAFAGGAFLALLEGWPAVTGFRYVVSNLAALPTPLTAASPVEAHGQIGDIVVSIWAMLLENGAMGMVCVTGLLSIEIVEGMPNTVCGFLRYTLLYVPVLFHVVSLVFGMILSVMEGWDALDGYLLLGGMVCGLETPLTDKVPTSSGALFFCCLVLLIEFALTGAIVGVVAGHPKASAFVQLLEGSGPEEDELEDEPAPEVTRPAEPRRRAPRRRGPALWRLSQGRCRRGQEPASGGFRTG